MLIFSYDQWAAEQRQALEEKNPLIDCKRCYGEGEITEECECCGVESDKECPDCKGAGEFHYRDLPYFKMTEFYSRPAYFQAVIRELRQWCAFTRDDFLQLAGRFVNEYRQGR